jgi:PadR family transcriptional regulator, regulatory protein PadR
MHFFHNSVSSTKRRKGVHMVGRDRIGEFEQLVLLAILRLGTKAYGITIRDEIEERAQRKTSVGALYMTLERLEQKGLISSDLGEATSERGGRAKRYFTINPSGRDALKASLESVRRMADGYFPMPEAI